jgi:hypothetical protein
MTCTHLPSYGRGDGDLYLIHKGVTSRCHKSSNGKGVSEVSDKTPKLKRGRNFIYNSMMIHIDFENQNTLGERA